MINKKEYNDAAGAINSAIDGILKAPAKRTADLGGPLGTQAFAGAVADALEESSVLS